MTATVPVAASALEVAQQLAETLAMVIRAVVTMPEAVRVEVVTTEGPVMLLVVHTASVDIGRVVGRGGRQIATLRSLASQMAQRAGCRVFVDVAASMTGRGGA